MYWNFLFKKCCFIFIKQVNSNFLNQFQHVINDIDKETEPHPWRGKGISLVLMWKFSWQNHVCIHSRTANNILTVWCLINESAFLLIIRIHFGHGSCGK